MLSHGLTQLKQWSGVTALVLVLTGGVAYAANTIGSADVIDNSLTSADLRNNQVRSADVKDNSLTGADLLNGSVGNPELSADSVDGSTVLDNSIGSADILDASVGYQDLAVDSVTGGEVVNGSLRGGDVGEAQFLRFTAQIPNIAPRTCVKAAVTGLPIDARDHLVLTEDVATAAHYVLSRPLYSSNAGTMYIQSCNLDINLELPHDHTFNLLVIDAQ